MSFKGIVSILAKASAEASAKAPYDIRGDHRVRREAPDLPFDLIGDVVVCGGVEFQVRDTALPGVTGSKAIVLPTVLNVKGSTHTFLSALLTGFVASGHDLHDPAIQALVQTYTDSKIGLSSIALFAVCMSVFGEHFAFKLYTTCIVDSKVDTKPFIDAGQIVGMTPDDISRLGTTIVSAVLGGSLVVCLCDCHLLGQTNRPHNGHFVVFGCSVGVDGVVNDDTTLYLMSDNFQPSTAKLGVFMRALAARGTDYDTVIVTYNGSPAVGPAADGAGPADNGAGSANDGPDPFAQ